MVGEVTGGPDLRRIFQGAAVGIAVAGEDRRLEYVNAAFCRILGRTAEEVVGTDFLLLTHPDDREFNEELFRELAAGERDSFVLEKRFLHPGRGKVWSRVSVSLLQSEAGRPKQMVAVAEDVTTRKEAEAEARRASYMVELAGRMARVGGWELDLATGTARWSDVVCDIHEVPHGTVVPLAEALDYYPPEWREVVSAAVQESVETGTPFDLELEILTARGRRVWVRAMGEAVRDAEGEVGRVRGAFQDISFLKASQASIREREAAFHHLAESMPHIVWGATGEGVVDWATSRLGSYCGVPVRQLMGEGWLSMVHPDDRTAVVEAWTDAISAARPYRSEFRIRRHDGEFRWHLVQAEPVLDQEGGVARWYGVALDVHDRRRIEEEARRLAERLTTTLESVTDAVFTLDDEWRFTFVNREAEILVERSRDQLLGVRIWDAFPETVGSAFELEYRRALTEETPRHFEAFYPPLDRWFSVHAYPSEKGLAVFYRDVTAERAASEDIRVAEERFRNVARATSDAIWDWEFATNQVWWSPGMRDTFGHDLTTFAPDATSWTSRIHPDDVDRVEASIHEAIAGTSETWEASYRFRRGDESWARVFDRGFIVRNADGRAVRMVGGMSDRTREFDAMEQLREQADLLDRARDAILVRGLDHSIIFWNAGAERIYGWTRDEAVGESARDLLCSRPEDFDAAVREVLAEGEWSGELQHRTKSGETIAVEGRWSLVRDSDGAPERILAIETDVTERKKLTAQFFRAQRLESIGTLAGGIAHDLNNVLAPILLSIGMLRDEAEDEGTLETLETIEASARRGAEMVKQVLGFARGVEGDRVIVDLRHIVHELTRVVRDTFPKNITLTTSLADDRWAIRGDPTQIHQVLLNLLVNARDAMPAGGAIQLVAENVTLDEQYAGMSREVDAGRYLRITVEDTGSGMPPEIVEQIFDPFFTTKGVGEGTGLGLSTVQAIVTSHGGFVRVYSEPGSGTTFRIHLPAVLEGEEETLPETVKLRRGQGELVLVVDDESSVREITRQTLEAFGYRVLTAADGAEAVAVYGRRGNEIDVVLTDITMPIMDGVAAIRALKHLNPEIRVIAASGLGTNGETARAAALGVRHFIPKPYTAETLLQLLHTLLAEDREQD